MREAEPSTRPGGNDHPAVQGVIIGLVQYAPSFPDMLTVSKLLFPSPAFPGRHPLLSEMPALALQSNSISPTSPVGLSLTPAGVTEMCCRSRVKCQQPGIGQVALAQPGGVCGTRRVEWAEGRAVTAVRHTAPAELCNREHRVFPSTARTQERLPRGKEGGDVERERERGKKT